MIVRFEIDGTARLGRVQGDEVVDLTELVPGAPTDIGEVLRKGPDALDALESAQPGASTTRHALAGLQYLPPCARPGKILCLGLNYLDHAAEANLERPEHPVVFLRTSTSLVAHGQPLVRPSCSKLLDYEGELVAFVGRRARHVPRDQALSIIAGYSLFNDASIRDYQMRTPQWTLGKNFDGTGGFGPGFVAARELPPGAAGLRLETRLNGRAMQSTNTADMIFDVAETVSLLTECLTLEPGDLLVMGTPSGIGATRKPPVFMRPGDVCEVEIERIGVLRNPIVQEAV